MAFFLETPMGQGICGMHVDLWQASSSPFSGSFFAEISGVLRNWGLVSAVAHTPLGDLG